MHVEDYREYTKVLSTSFLANLRVLFIPELAITVFPITVALRPDINWTNSIKNIASKCYMYLCFGVNKHYYPVEHIC